MLNKILIVDDSELDRKSIRKVFAKVTPNAEISEAPNIGVMYHLLGPDVDLLVQDISFEKNSEPDSTGLNALYDVVEYYSGLPIVIITGHYFDKVKEFHSGYLWRKNNIIGYHDKSTFSKLDAENIVKLATEIKKDRLASEEVKERLEFLEARGRELEDQLKLRKVEDEVVAQASLYQRAFTGHNLSECIEAEAKITGGNANYSAFRICREIELQVKQLVKNTSAENQTFFQKVAFIRKVHGMSIELFNSIHEAWSIRNGLIHDQKSTSVKGAHKLLHVLQLFKEDSRNS